MSNKLLRDVDAGALDLRTILEMAKIARAGRARKCSERVERRAGGA